jgi:hypothetical protein
MVKACNSASSPGRVGAIGDGMLPCAGDLKKFQGLKNKR